MTGQYTEGFLQQLPRNSAGELDISRRYPLSRTQEVIVGRDSSCQIVLDSNIYGMVSRRHVVFRPMLNSGIQRRWLICDLNSANGTYVNGRRLEQCQELRAGDRITLGYNGAEFVFEYTTHLQHTLQSAPKEALQLVRTSSSEQSVSFTQLFPIAATAKDLTSKAYLIPGVLTVIFVVLMFATVGRPETAYFNQILVAIYLAGAAYYFIYQLCGKRKPWWAILGVAIASFLILLSPILPLFIFVFRGLLPGHIPLTADSVSFPELLMRMFFGAGLMEELLKALPVLCAYIIGRRLQSPWRERIGIAEPLDGILLGTASAMSFTLVETLRQYVPEITHNAAAQGGVGELVGFQLLIPRILGSIAGHMAYSGYFGYFIGLSVLKSRKRWRILGTGYLSAAILHALWNATGLLSSLLLAVVGVVSYAFLTAAILKARVISPTRSQNFATWFGKRS
ncbi:PrsW family glutamic-type intramembrane protease [Gloeocapsopsis dulcis]|uniref:PrsW family intramembrane metalloprotease n=1 Tax=Gloeocapsopsis dulcis AAB1 = 1H9 TaxID=1433147 RepID=A0A6N8FW35_9CHRO|nr:PrsW family glutamic-type intramembrane protease [Gloeocapsopsis dulcis]MUL36156.1 PrsW family intramembrane metalloprotease [Gloeocapsopsis dulcis AAB1 = 1H9]WNN91369.1 PrsW family glutamic-type intramembrane protease [Gloeocapsopsis dulcis]